MERRSTSWLLTLVLLIWTGAASNGATPASFQDGEEQPFTPSELEQMLAPLALYPDDLIAQILMAATYPHEIVDAERWGKAQRDLDDQTRAMALEMKDWDPSVKSLVAFPGVLDMLSHNLRWTTSVGDAYLAQPKDVLAAIQELRARANEAGNLDSNSQQTVVVDDRSEVIEIGSTDPEEIYVPYYDPELVYGDWPYADLPPYRYWPPNRPAIRGMRIAFGVGVRLGAAWGYAWGRCDWAGRDIDIDIDRNVEFNRTIKRDVYRDRMTKNAERRPDGSYRWQHDARHRRGTGYRDSITARKYGGRTVAQAQRARSSYRGHASTARSGRSSASSTAVTRTSRSARSATTTPSRRSQAVRSSRQHGTSASAFSGVHHGGDRARQIRARGHASRGHASSGHARRGGRR